ncbi:MAG: hypothetical protein R6X02_03185 [Enhygromyxa sp.]
MTNPIFDSTQRVLAGLEPTTLEAARASVRVRSLETLGEPVSLEDQIYMLVAAKYLSAADGLSNAELTGLRLLMRKYKLPDPVVAEVLEFDVERLTPRDVGELALGGTRRSCYMLSGMVGIAALDGLSDDELARARAVGAAFGLPPKLVAAVVAEAKASVYAVLRGDASMLDQLREVRRAIFAFAE